MIKRVNREDALFSIDGGDLVSYGEMDQFKCFLEQAGKLNKPLLTVVGNHDITRGGRLNYKLIFGDFYYSFVVGNSYFIILDDAAPDSLTTKQIRWLESELAKSKGCKYRFVFMHLPLYNPIEGLYKLNPLIARGLNDLFNKNKITMLFTSHLHGYFEGKWEETPYIITGGAGAPLSGSDPKHFFHHYIKVNVTDNGCSYEVVKIDKP